MHLSDKALLVHLGISQWIAKKLDKKASAEIAARNGAVSGSGNFNKSLLPTCTSLDAVKAKTSIIRKKFYANTLPWGIEGTFILPSDNYLTFMTEFRKEKAQWDAYVTAFLGEYDQAHMDAQRLLGGLYNRNDYPILADLKEKFKMDMAILPVPVAGDFRVELADGEAEQIQADVEQRVAASSQAAMDDVWKRLFDKVEWIADRLSKPENTFHTETYEDAQDMVKMLKRLNFTNDPDLEASRVAVENKLFSYHPETLRNDPDIRRDAAKEADDIMNKMRGFMGGAA